MIIYSRSDLENWVKTECPIAAPSQVDRIVDVFENGSPDYGTDWTVWLGEAPENLMEIIETDEARAIGR